MDERQYIEATEKESVGTKKNVILREIVSFALHVLAAWVAAFLFVTYVGSFSVVDGDSMQSTLENGEHLWIDKLSYNFSEPERFDIIIFPFEQAGDDVFYIKRIIGMPGEELYIDEAGSIFIDGELLEEDFGNEAVDAFRRIRAEEPVLLGEDEYFVMGDNRNNSKDSRYYEVGNIKEEDIVGKAVLRLWPLDSFGFID